MRALLLVALVVPGEVAFPELLKDGVSAQLHVEIPEQGAGPGLARCHLVVDLRGPASLDVDNPRLEDALAAWRISRQASSWYLDGGQCHITRTLTLVQVKPGMAPLPGLVLRVRTGPGGNWHELSWPEILREPRTPLSIETPVGTPEQAWPTVFPYLAIAFLLVLVTTVSLVVWRRHRPQPLTPQEAALLETSRTTDLPQLAEVLRRYLEARTLIPATRLTTQELLAALQPILAPAHLADILDILEQSDRAKFAGLTQNSDFPLALEKTRRLIGVLADSVPVAKTSDSGEFPQTG